MKDLLLLTDYRGALRQRQQTWQSLDLEKLTSLLHEGGLRVARKTFEQIANAGHLPQGRLIHYTSTQDPGYRRFLDDILFELSRDNTLVPRYEIFRAHENKGYQELLRSRLGLPEPAACYLGNLKGAEPYFEQMVFPQVLKSPGGFQSSGVHMVNNPHQVRNHVRRMNRPSGYMTYRLKEFLKKHLLKSRYHQEMYEDCPFGGNYILQQFLPGATGDWKVLVFGDHLYCLRRSVRPGDFRASGSGRFKFETPGPGVLDFAADFAQRLEAPMVSLDIIERGEDCHLIEFQGLHFGTYTIDEAPGYHEKVEDRWRFVSGALALENEYADALLAFINNLPPSNGSHE